MLFTEFDNICLAYQRFTAGVNVHVYAHVLALANDVVDLVKTEIQLVAIFCSPAAGTMKIAGRGGVQQYRPGNVAVVFIPQFLLFFPADEIGVDEEVDRYGGQYFRIYILNHMPYIWIIGGVRIRNGRTDCIALAAKLTFGEFICPVHQLRQIFLGILVEIFEHRFQSEFFDSCRYTHVCILLLCFLWLNLTAFF